MKTKYNPRNGNFEEWFGQEKRVNIEQPAETKVWYIANNIWTNLDLEHQSSVEIWIQGNIYIWYVLDCWMTLLWNVYYYC